MKTKQLTQFRDEVYQNFKNCKRTDMLMDLVDALSSNTTARSVVELSLNPHFRRHYTAMNKAIVVEALTDKQLAGLACQTIDEPVQREFHLLGTDVTSNPRPVAYKNLIRGRTRYSPRDIDAIRAKFTYCSCDNRKFINK